MPSSGGFSNPTAVLAEKIAQFNLNIELVKSIVTEVTENYADGVKSFYDAMLMAVTDEGVTYEFLYTRGLIYHSKYVFSEARKHFYFSAVVIFFTVNNLQFLYIIYNSGWQQPSMYLWLTYSQSQNAYKCRFDTS